MKAVELRIHNFRSICDLSIRLDNLSILVGANNAGKSTVIDAIRVFYGKLKFDSNKDFPQKGATDKESWIEIEYKPSDDEYEDLKDEYKSESNTFKVRNYMTSEVLGVDGKHKSGLYAYVNGELSEDRFYGFKNVGQGKFGDIIYIPAVSRIDEHTKLTGPSALRDLLNAVLVSVLETSSAYKALNTSFSEFGGAVKTETTDEGYSLQGIEDDISNELENWGTKFRLIVNSVGVDDIIKNLISHEIFDESLETAQIIGSYGQGFQRSVIFSLIRVAAKYAVKKEKLKKKDFSPNLTWILFEEPEAFLHPTQINVLSANLRTLASGESNQCLLSTHNPLFLSHSIREMHTICRLQRCDCQCRSFQISVEELNKLLESNQQEVQDWLSSGMKIEPDDLRIDMEAIKYTLWLDSKRNAAFFSEKVLLVEGPTEIALFSYMQDQGLLNSCNDVFVMDTIGKFNMHRFMKLFGQFGIRHYVLFDSDSNKLQAVDTTIQLSQNQFTGGIDSFPTDLEKFLGIQDSIKSHRKPQHMMFQIEKGNVDLQPLAEKINNLVVK